MSDDPPSPEAVLGFWFADALGDPAAAWARVPFWFGGGPAIDQQVADHLGAAFAAATRGSLPSWEFAPRPCLALVILFDQVPRNLFRRTAQAFAQDAHALALALRAIQAGYFPALGPLEQAFLLMPFQHSECLDVQRRGFGLWDKVLDAAAPPWRPLLEDFLGHARGHLEIIERFGRFPHRNAILGRPPTAEEREFMEAGGARFGQG
jgi:uncharacterized protein (DUF924 family)